MILATPKCDPRHCRTLSTFHELSNEWSRLVARRIMKVPIAIDSSPVSQRILEEVAARPCPSITAFCIVSAVEVDRFSELPALVADAKT